MFDIPFICYAAHKQSIEDYINAIARSVDPDSEYTRHQAARDANLNPLLLDKYEKAYIEEQISRRRIN